MSKDSLLNANEKNRQDALEAYVLNYQIQLQTGIEKARINIANITAQMKSLENEKTGEVYIELDGQSVNSQVVYLKQSELSAVYTEIKNAEDLLKAGRLELAQLERSIEKCSVKAELDGYVNLKTTLVKNDVLSAGAIVMTVLPMEPRLAEIGEESVGISEHKVEIYVNNQDIGKLSEGMRVKCDVYALPSEEYGYVYGTVTKLSKDIYTEGNAMGYYLAEAMLDRSGLMDKNGTVVSFKVGMGCKVKTITGEKSILRFVIEKLDLWD